MYPIQSKEERALKDAELSHEIKGGSDLCKCPHLPPSSPSGTVTEQKQIEMFATTFHWAGRRHKLKKIDLKYKTVVVDTGTSD